MKWVYTEAGQRYLERDQGIFAFAVRRHGLKAFRKHTIIIPQEVMHAALHHSPQALAAVCEAHPNHHQHLLKFAKVFVSSCFKHKVNQQQAMLYAQTNVSRAVSLKIQWMIYLRYQTKRN